MALKQEAYSCTTEFIIIYTYIGRMKSSYILYLRNKRYVLVSHIGILYS